MSNLYNRISAICKEHNTNVTALCKKAGVGRATLSELNAGRTKTLNTDTLTKLAAALNVSVDYLLGTEQKNQPTPVSKDELKHLDKIDQQIMDYVKRMTLDQKFLLLAQMQVLTGQEEALRLSQAGAFVGAVTES